jgi:hypothetical protein
MNDEIEEIKRRLDALETRLGMVTPKVELKVVKACPLTRGQCDCKCETVCCRVHFIVNGQWPAEFVKFENGDIIMHVWKTSLNSFDLRVLVLKGRLVPYVNVYRVEPTGVPYGD